MLHLLQLGALAGQRLLELVQLGGAHRQLGGQAVALLLQCRQVSTQLGGALLCRLLQLGLQGVHHVVGRGGGKQARPQGE